MRAIELLKRAPDGDPHRTKILHTIEVNSRRGADPVRQVLSFAPGLDGWRVAIHLAPLIKDLEGVISEIFPRNIRVVVKRINPAIKIIAASGIDSGANVAQAMNAGVHDFRP